MKSLFLFFLFVSTCTFAQDPIAKLPPVTGPSPDVASLQKYGDYKVSTYTGVPDITLPVYVINLGDLSVPISVSYHGGGIKVDEEASRVGLGWTLNAGGTISRNIIGLDDLSYYGLGPNSFDLIGFPVYSVVSQFSLDFAAHTYNISGLVGVTVDPSMPNLDVDLEPDNFYCNLLGNSSKFILRKSDTAAIFEDPSSNMKVKISIVPYNTQDTAIASGVGMNCTITVTTNDGTTYFFDRFESCATVSPSSTVQPRITAWYLTKIRTVKGTVVNFNYTESVASTVYSLNRPNITRNLWPLTGEPVGPVPGFSPHSTYRNLFLSSITTPNCNVYFNYDGRVDIKGDKRLSSIQVKDGQGAMIKTVNLIQDYFAANSSPANTYDLQSAIWGGPALDSNWLTKRLKLTEFREVSADNQTTLTHKFMYNETLLPLKNSTSRDHWGYFNNAANGAQLLPDIMWAYPGLIKIPLSPQYLCSNGPDDPNDFGYLNVGYLETPHKYYNHYDGANREVDTNYSRAFILKEIDYPTGGFTKFDFEQNTYDKRKSFANDYNAALYDFLSKMDTIAFIPGIQGIPNGYSQTFSFSVTAADTLLGEGVGVMSFVLRGMHTGSNSSNTTDLTQISIYNSSNTLIGQTMFRAYSELFSSGGEYSTYPVNMRLPVGNYTVKITIGGNIVDRNSPFYRLTRSWNARKDVNTDGIMYKYAGGVRIRNISNYTDAGSLATSINYLYHFTADSNNNGINEIYSTGKIMERPNYFDADLTASGHKLYLKSEAGANVNIGYDSVVIQQGNNRRLEAYNNSPYRPSYYKTYYTFTEDQMMPIGLDLPFKNIPGVGTPGDDLYLDEFFDYVPQGIKSFFDNANGKLTKSVDYLYDPVGHTYKLLKQTNTTYTYSGTGIQGINWADRMYVAASGYLYVCMKGLPPIYGVTNYFYPSLRSVAVLPATTIEKNYSGTDVVTDTITYAYSLNNQLKTKAITNSKGESLVESYTYPLDFVNVTGGNSLSNAIVALKNKNIVAPVIEKYVQKKTSSGTLIGTVQASITSYKPASQLPDTVWAAELTQPFTAFTPLNALASTLIKDGTYKPQLIYSKYDAAGNISTQQRYRDLNNVYLWDYSGDYPVCQVTNADSADIAYTSFEADNPGNWVIGTGNLTSSGGLTGSKYYALSAGATISKTGLTAAKSYVVTYWSKAGSLTVNGATAIALYTKQGWTLYSHKLAAGATSVTVSGNGIPVDELRLLPIDAQMTTYTYQPLAGMTSQCDPASKITYYEYDGLQRLQRIRDIDGNIIKQFEYKYQAAVNQ